MSKKTIKELESSISSYYLKRFPITMRQLRLALNNANILIDFENSIVNLPTDKKTVAEIEWQYADKVYRYDDWFMTVINQMEISSDAVDDLFNNGYNI